jgi:hypothetical protein
VRTRFNAFFGGVKPPPGRLYHVQGIMDEG